MRKESILFQLFTKIHSQLKICTLVYDVKFYLGLRNLQLLLPQIPIAFLKLLTLNKHFNEIRLKSWCKLGEQLYSNFSEIFYFWFSFVLHLGSRLLFY